jgi:hypothetical protein
MADYEEIDRSNIPRATSYSLGTCGDPNCGPHILANDKDGRPIIEIVMSREQGMRAAMSILAIISGKVGE